MRRAKTSKKGKPAMTSEKHMCMVLGRRAPENTHHQERGRTDRYRQRTGEWQTTGRAPPETKVQKLSRSACAGQPRGPRLVAMLTQSCVGIPADPREANRDTVPTQDASPSKAIAATMPTAVWGPPASEHGPPSRVGHQVAATERAIAAPARTTGTTQHRFPARPGTRTSPRASFPESESPSRSCVTLGPQCAPTHPHHLPECRTPLSSSRTRCKCRTVTKSNTVLSVT